MSQKYPGGVISKTAPTPSGAYATSTAPGVWTLEQQAYWQKLGQWPTAGNNDPSLFIENLFSTYLYTGTNATQTITNSIDLSGKGGMVWLSGRTSTNYNCVLDTVRGLNVLNTQLTDAQFSSTANNTFNSFNSNGFTLGSDSLNLVNRSTYSFASWTFREQAKFFDVVTYTGTGANATIAHNLGSEPGCIIIKQTNTARSWQVYHRSLGATKYLELNGTAASNTDATEFRATPDATSFYLGTSASVNQSGGTYVAYLFAHDAGGFGLTGTDNVISCGSFTTSGAGAASVTLGYEPQWILLKPTSTTGNWFIYDIARDWTNGLNDDRVLYANLTNTETNNGWGTTGGPNSTGFSISGFGASITYVYVVIRRGPMAVPTVGTSVYSAVAYTGAGGSTRTITTGTPPDLVIAKSRSTAGDPAWFARITGGTRLLSDSTDVESGTSQLYFASGTTNVQWQTSNYDASGTTYIMENLRRAPGVFDIVTYTGTGSATAVSHNLQAVPQLIITKSRSAVEGWPTVALSSGTSYYSLSLDTTGTGGSPTNLSAYISSTSITPYAFSNATSGVTYIAYLFSTTPGVSKVGSYTGTGTTLQVNCGFTTGARFVMIKRADSSGDWYVWDSTRGIVAGNDPYFLMNTSAAEVTTTDYVDTYSAGFELSSTAPAALNASGGTFIFLAIA